MNAELAESHREAFLEHREAFGVSMTINSETVTVVANDAEFSRELIEGGFSTKADVKVHYLIADFVTPPVLGMSAAYQGAVWRIIEASARPGALIGELRLEPRSGR